MKNKPKLCSKDHMKVSLSESAALRRLNRYDEVKRMYFCDHCSSWHLTKTTEYINKHDEPPPSRKDEVVDKQKWIKKRLETLIKRQKQDEKV